MRIEIRNISFWILIGALTWIISGLVICSVCRAQAPMWAWDVVYIESSALGTIAFNHLVFKSEDYYWDSFFATLGIAILKEIGDEFYRAGYFGKPRSTHWFWDSRGFDSRDLGLVCLSITISFPLRFKGKRCLMTMTH